MDAIKEALLKHLLKQRESKGLEEHEDPMKSGVDHAPSLKAEGAEDLMGLENVGEHEGDVLGDKEKLIEALLGGHNEASVGREPKTLSERAHHKMKGSLEGLQKHKLALKK